MILEGDESHFFIDSRCRITNGAASQGWRAGGGGGTEPSVTLPCLPRLPRGSSPLLPTVIDLLPPNTGHFPGEDLRWQGK